MWLLKRGAEASLFIGEYLGKKCVVKRREKKIYRENNLDAKILKERMRAECTLLSMAKKAGVRTPMIWKISTGENEIVMEHIEGKTLKEELMGCKKETAGICANLIGESVAKLHSSGLVHGDLTTSNIILHKGALVFLDFGLGRLSKKTEDLAVDFLALKKTFFAAHYRIAGEWKAIEASYARHFAGGAAVLGQIKEVEARARYS